MLVSERVGEFFFEGARLEYTEFGVRDRVVILLHAPAVAAPDARAARPPDRRRGLPRRSPSTCSATGAATARPMPSVTR